MVPQSPLCGCDRSTCGYPKLAHPNDSITYFEWVWSAKKRLQMLKQISPTFLRPLQKPHLIRMTWTSAKDLFVLLALGQRIVRKLRIVNRGRGNEH
jgi:hypothetical protein